MVSYCDDSLSLSHTYYNIMWTCCIYRWYRPDYNLAEPMKYGQNLGCDFVEQSCLTWIKKKQAVKYLVCVCVCVRACMRVCACTV